MRLYAGRRQFYLGAVILSVAFLGFLVGAYVTQFQTWPYPRLRNSLVAVLALRSKLSHPGQYGWYFFDRARTADVGVRRYDPERACNGLTLFNSGHSQATYLIAMDGQVVHQWLRPFSSVFSDPHHLPDGVPPDEYVRVRKAHLFPNGDLLAIYEHGGGSPWGCGLVKMDQDSRVLWSFADHVHHDLAVVADGRIVTLTHRTTTEPIAGLPPEVRPPLIEDYVVVLSAEGVELQRLAVTQAIRNSDFAALLDGPKPGLRGDLWHTNAVEIVPPGWEERFGLFRAGQVMVSLRRTDTLAVVDLDEGRVVWASRGPWDAQHDPDLLPNGNVLLFDNRGHYGPGGGSRVLEIDPATLAIRWQYAGTREDPFDSEAAGSQQRLPNGNTLITESHAGRLLEVTADQEVVWEYSSPHRAPSDPLSVAIIYEAQRYCADELRFLPERAAAD